MISGVIILCAYFAANYFFGLSKNNADGSVNDFFYLLGIIIIITSIVGAVIAIARAAKKEFGICSNGILLDAFDTRYHANGSKRGQHAFCLSAWFPETNQYCRRIKCGDLRSWTYGSFEKGGNHCGCLMKTLTLQPGTWTVSATPVSEKVSVVCSAAEALAPNLTAP